MKLALTAIALALATSAAFAADKPKKGFDALDKNNDGYISKEEAKGTPHDKDFAKLDKNGDGKLSREEHAAAPEHAGDKRPATTSSSTPAPSGGTAQGKRPYY